MYSNKSITKERDALNLATEISEIGDPPYKNSDFLYFFKPTLSKHELSEIVDYPIIYYWGQNYRKDNNTWNFYGFDDEKGNYIAQISDQIAYRYEIVRLLGKGSFGQVFECIDHKDNASIALKIIKNKKRFNSQAHTEIKILKLLVQHDPEGNNNVLLMKDYFLFRNHICITTELLGLNLYETVKFRNFLIFPHQKLKQIASQLLKSLKYLKRLNIIHCDLKPENILFTLDDSEKLKIVDFGASCMLNEKFLAYIQSRSYRAPEIILGIPYDCSIDIWSLGCILVELNIGKPLFQANNEIDLLRKIIQTRGMIPEEMIAISNKKHKFFKEGNILIEDFDNEIEPSSMPLSKILNDEYMFIDFIERCLELEPSKRITPEDALNHPWLKAQLLKPKEFQFKIQRSKKKNLIINCLWF